MIHLILHFLVPLTIAVIFTRKKYLKPFFIMSATMLVDLDHLIATPIYEASRCSIGFHPLHTILPIVCYLVICFIPKLRWIGVGLILHMALDSIDCQINQGIWFVG